MPVELSGFNIVIEDLHCLVLEPAEGAELIDYQVEMITGNSIPGLLSADARRRDNLVTICYNTEKFISLRAYLNSMGITRDQFVLLINHLKSIFREARRFLLTEESLILEEEYIFVKEDLKEIALLYVPGKIRQNLDASLQDLLLRVIARSADAGEPDMARLVENLKEKNVQVHNLDSLIKQFFVQDKDFKNLTAPYAEASCGHDSQAGRPPANNTDVKGKEQLEASTGKIGRFYLFGAIAAAVLLTLALSSAGKSLPGLQAAAGGLLALGSAGAVLYVFLKTRETSDKAGISRAVAGAAAAEGLSESAGGEVSRHSISLRGGFFVPVVYKKAVKKTDRQAINRMDFDKIPLLRIVKEGKEATIELGKKEFYIGRSRAVADYGDIDDKGVEPLHAKIINRDNELLIVDLGSEKGTYVNGQRIDSGRPCPIRSGDVIVLAGQEFVFDDCRE